MDGVRGAGRRTSTAGGRLVLAAVRIAVPVRLVALVGSVVAVVLAIDRPAPAVAVMLLAAGTSTALAVVMLGTGAGASPLLRRSQVWLDLTHYLVLAAAVDPGASANVWLVTLIVVGEAAQIAGPGTAVAAWSTSVLATSVVAVATRGAGPTEAAALVLVLVALSIVPAAIFVLQSHHVSDALRRVRHVERRLRQQATTDELTGCANRRGLRERLAARPATHHLHVLFLDLDGFKQVNDTLGHEAGDDVLRFVADRLRTLRGSEGTLCRLAGDEFVLVVRDLEDVAVEALVEAARRVVAAPIVTRGVEVTVAASIGVARGDAGEELLALLDAADAEMYREKHGVAGQDAELVARRG